MKTIYLDTNKELNRRKIKKIIQKLYRANKKEDIVIAMSKTLLSNKELCESINNAKLKVLDGRWLFKFLLYEIIEYISIINNRKMETQTVAILIENHEEVITSQLFEIAKKIKTLKIITNTINYFNYLENILYEECGIAIQITNNRRKSLSNVDMIINFDYEEEKINEYNINPTSIIVNIQNKVQIKRNDFIGANINNYKITYDKDKFENIYEENKFESNVIYESYIYRKDTYLNIKKQLKSDGVRLIGLIEDNGKYYLKKNFNIMENYLDKRKILA